MEQLDLEYVSQQIILLYTKGRPTTEGINEDEVQAWVKEALAFEGLTNYTQNIREFGQHRVNGDWLVPFKLPVTMDEILGHKVAVLTEAPISLPKNRGFVSCSYKGKDNIVRPIDRVDFEVWEGIPGGALNQFVNKYYYASLAGKIVLLPACPDEPIPFDEVRTLFAVANDATMTDTKVMLVYEQVFPKLNLRYGIVPDTKTDNFPTTQ